MFRDRRHIGREPLAITLHTVKHGNRLRPRRRGCVVIVRRRRRRRELHTRPCTDDNLYQREAHTNVYVHNIELLRMSAVRACVLFYVSHSRTFHPLSVHARAKAPIFINHPERAHLEANRVAPLARACARPLCLFHSLILQILHT